jgi:nucleotide-binding universal stress UspA family protein
MSGKPAGARRHAAAPVEDGPCLIVGYDGSESARTAARWAAEALPATGRLVLLYAAHPLHAPSSPLASEEERRRLGQAVLDELALDGDEAIVRATAHAEVSCEDPISALVEAAHRHQAEGIVVGCRRRSRLHRALGTVTSELPARSPVPVTVVPSHSDEQP